jgi:metal-sulfur cluster biosynthetic enzyme
VSDLSAVPALRQEILQRLDPIQDPCSVASGVPMGLTEMGLVGSVEIGDDRDVVVHLRLTSPFCHMILFMQAETKREVGSLDGVRSVRVTGDDGLEWTPDLIAPEAQERRRKLLPVMPV